MLPETTNGEDQPPTNGEEQPPTNGEEQPPTNGEKTPTPEQEEKQIQRVERGLSTTEKVVIASLFLQLLTFAWGVYSFQARMRKEEKAA